MVEALHELNVQTIVSIPKVGPFDFSISNAVIYMWASAVIVFAFFFIVSRRLRKQPDGLQIVAEILLNFATGHLTGQIGEKGKKYYYLILTIFSYILVTNLIGLIPKPEFLRPYTPTTNINVTFGMAMVVFCVTQFQGISRHGVGGYMKTWLTPPGVPKALAAPLNGIFFVVHFMGEFFKPLSLSVRLFGNTIAGHLIILVMLGLLLEYASAVVIIPAALFVVIMTAFEVFVAFIQAYIFSLLSVVYIESAIYAGH
ncbi:MAG: ATP synthase F0 subunit A [Actinobacteria bacterium RBG_16_64_13]|nr:MAG: ATP synthase F0 subunit A [Actinobacteria bacterium RBG_16_64_13]